MEKFKTNIKKMIFFKKSFSGFSLLELSIVLVVLGVLTTGILRGFALIDTSKVVALSSELNRYTVATNQFYDRYDELPGVMRDPSKYWGSKAKSSNNKSSNVRLINPSGKPTDANSLNFFNHLALAGFLEDESLYIGSNTNLSNLNSIDENYYPFSKAMKGFFFYVRSDDVDGNYNRLNRISIASKEMGTGLNAKLIYMLDTKADDGLPLTGFISIVPTALSKSNTSSIGNYDYNNSIIINNAYAENIDDNTCLKRVGGSSNIIDDYTRKSIEYNIKGTNCEFFKTLDTVEPNTITQSAFDNAFSGASCKVDTRLCDSNSVRYVSTITNGSSIDITCPSNYTGGGSLLCSDGTLIGCKKVCTYTGCENSTFVSQYNSLPANVNRNSYDNSGTRNFPLNETITFSCALGYEGNASLKCINRGTWTLSNNCVIKTCSNTNPNTPNNYNLVSGVGTTNYSTNKVFYCNSCYENSTSNSISLHCGVDGGNNMKWQINSGYNTCTMKQCDKSVVPAEYTDQLVAQSGKVNCDKTATFDCGIAYVGTVQFKCGTNKSWEHLSGSCVIKTCDISSPLSGYNVVGKTGKVNYGETIDFNCKTGYENNTNDKVSMKCTDAWSVVNGNACTIKKCDNTKPLDSYDVASLNGTTDYGNSALFPCLAGYTGQVEMTCNEEGKWIYKSGQCIIKTCSASNIGTNLGSIYTSFNGNQISNWLKCNNENCTSATEIVNQANILNYKERITFNSCKTGYEKVGTTKLILRCNADSQWEKISGTEKCQIVTCNHNDQDIADRNIYQEEGKTIDYNIQTTFACKTGYKGSVIMKCNASGKWDYIGGVCNIKQCDNGGSELDSLNITKGTSGTLSNYNTQKTFNCKTGYENSNSSAITMICNNEEKWDIVKGGACTIKTCDNTKPTSGLYIAASTGVTNYNISKTFNCQTGYEGAVTLKCNSNAEWDYVNGQCTIVKCPAISTLTNDYGINWRTCTDNTCSNIDSSNLAVNTTVVYNTVITATDCPIKLPESMETNNNLLPKFICQADKTFKKLNRNNENLQSAGIGYCSSCSITRALNSSSSVIKSASSTNVVKWTKWGTSDLIVNTTGYANGVCLAGYIARDTWLNRNQLFPYCSNGKFGIYSNNCGINYCQKACNVSTELTNENNHYESLTITNGTAYSDVQSASNCSSVGYESKDSTGSFIAIKGSIYNSTCKTGYEGNHNLTCGDNGVWTKSGQCTIKKCANNNSVILGYNLVTLEGTTDYNISKEFICKTGYENTNNSKMTLKCNANAQWEIVSGTSCTIKKCSSNATEISLKHHALPTDSSIVNYLREKTFTCQSDYTSANEGKVNLVCGASGKWEVKNNPCIPQPWSEDSLNCGTAENQTITTSPNTTFSIYPVEKICCDPSIGRYVSLDKRLKFVMGTTNYINQQIEKLTDTQKFLKLVSISNESVDVICTDLRKVDLSKVGTTDKTFSKNIYFGFTSILGIDDDSNYKLYGANLKGANFDGAVFESNVNFGNSVNAGSNLQNAIFTNTTFKNTVYFGGSINSGSNLSYSNFSNSLFNGKVYFVENLNSKSDLTNANFSGATFNDRVTFGYFDNSSSNLTNANFRNAKFNSDVTFGYQNNSGSNLNNADFTNAAFKSVVIIFNKSNLCNTDFTGATINGKTITNNYFVISSLNSNNSFCPNGLYESNCNSNEYITKIANVSNCPINWSSLDCGNDGYNSTTFNVIGTYGSTKQGSTKVFKCKTGYESKDGNVTLTCGNGGIWTGASCTKKACNQYTPVYGLNNTQIGTQLLDSLYLTRYNTSETALIKYCNSTQLPSTSLQTTWGNTAKCMQEAGWSTETFTCMFNTSTNTLYWQQDKNACSFTNLNNTYATAIWNINNTSQQTGVAYSTTSGKVSEITGTCKTGYINSSQTKESLVLATCQSNGSWSIGSNNCISGCKISDLPSTMGQNTELFINHTGGFNSYTDKVGAKAYQKYVIPGGQWARGYCNDGYEADNTGTDIPNIISATLIYCNGGQWKQSGYAVNCNKYCRNNSTVKDKNNKIIGNSLYNIVYVYESNLLYPIVYCMDNTAGSSTSKQANTSFRILASGQAKCASEESWLTNNNMENKYFTCQNDGTWKWTQSACLSNELTTIANNTWNFKNTSYIPTDPTVFANGSVIKGTCNAGYTGSTTATCNSDGNWTTTGSCTIKTCNINNIPSNVLGHTNAKDGITNYVKCSNSLCSTTTGGALTSGSTVNYNEYLTINTCNSGYTKTGSNIVLRCNENSQWEKVSGDGGCRVKITQLSPFAEAGKYTAEYAGKVEIYKFNGENISCGNAADFGKDIHSGYYKACMINNVIVGFDGYSFNVEPFPAQKYCHLASAITEGNNNHINTDFQNTQGALNVVAENGKSLTVQCASGYGADDYYTNSSGILATCNNGSWTFDQSRKCVKSGCWVGNSGTINFNSVRKNVIVQAWGHNGESGGTRSCGGSGGAGGIGGYVGGIFNDSIDGFKITKISGGSGGGSAGGAAGGAGGAGYLVDLKSKKNNIFVSGGGGGGGAGGWGCSGSSCGPGRGGNGGNGNGNNGSNGTTPSGWGGAGGGAGGNYATGCYWEWINYCIVSWDCERREIEVCPSSYGNSANGQGGAGGGAGAGFGYYTTSCNQYVPSFCNTYYVMKGEGGHSGGDSSGCNNGGGGGGGTGGKNYVDQLSNNISTVVSAGGTYRVRICWGGNTSCNDYKTNYGSALNSTNSCETGDVTVE